MQSVAWSATPSGRQLIAGGLTSFHIFANKVERRDRILAVDEQADSTE